MPRSRKSLTGRQTATFIGGPLDGTSAPSMGYEHIVKATMEDNGAVRHWHWYELEIDEGGERRYRYVGSETRDWPQNFGSGE